jgi:hypothetical protein
MAHTPKPLTFSTGRTVYVHAAGARDRVRLAQHFAAWRAAELADAEGKRFLKALAAFVECVPDTVAVAEARVRIDCGKMTNKLVYLMEVCIGPGSQDVLHLAQAILGTSAENVRKAAKKLRGNRR